MEATLIPKDRPALLRTVLSGLFLTLGASLLFSGRAHAELPERIDLERPGAREFILDKANLITDADRQKIKQIADKLLTDKAAPIIVVTIDSMEKHGGKGLRIETFAHLWFDQWQIGPAKLGETSWNHGILLIISKNDRKARIELGAGWKRDKDEVAMRIMDERIVPRFKQGDFSGGIVQGVEALDKMARDLKLPATQRSGPPSQSGSGSRSMAGYLIVAVVIGLAVFTAVSLIRRGSGGWAWLLWGLVFGVVGAILYVLLSSRSDGSGGGGGYSGGSFGGGFSGGGGATGSW